MDVQVSFPFAGHALRATADYEEADSSVGLLPSFTVHFVEIQIGPNLYLDISDIVGALVGDSAEDNPIDAAAWDAYTNASNED